MAAIYAKLILRGEKTIDDVPAVIREQVLKILAEDEAGDAAPEVVAEYSSMTTAQLKEETEARGLAVTTGMKKADIIALLEEDDATN